MEPPLRLLACLALVGCAHLRSTDFAGTYTNEHRAPGGQRLLTTISLRPDGGYDIVAETASPRGGWEVEPGHWYRKGRGIWLEGSDGQRAHYTLVEQDGQVVLVEETDRPAMCAGDSAAKIFRPADGKQHRSPVPAARFCAR